MTLTKASMAAGINKFIYLNNEMQMRSSLMVRATDWHCNCCNGPGFDRSIRRNSGIWGAADEAVLNKVHQVFNKEFGQSTLTMIHGCLVGGKTEDET